MIVFSPLFGGGIDDDETEQMVVCKPRGYRFAHESFTEELSHLT